MPTFAADQELDPLEIERRTSAAWSSYRLALEELTGREYEDAEVKAWDRLQRRLAKLAG